MAYLGGRPTAEKFFTQKNLSMRHLGVYYAIYGFNSTELLIIKCLLSNHYALQYI